MPDQIKPASDHSSAFAPPDAFGSDYYKLLLEQYKMYVDTSTKVSERRATAQTFFLSANSLLATAYGLAAGRGAASGAAGAGSTSWQGLVPIVGLMLALSWYALIRAYGTLNNGKFQVIGEIEKRLPVAMFDLEWTLLQRGRGWAHMPLTYIERFIPLIFALFFLLLTLKAQSLI